MKPLAPKKSPARQWPTVLDGGSLPPLATAPDWASLLPSLAAMGKGLSDPNRLRILLALAGGRKPVGRVVEELGLSQPLVSHHLKELRQAGLLKVEREGPFVFYEMAGPQVLDALQALASLAKRGVR